MKHEEKLSMYRSVKSSVRSFVQMLKHLQRPGLLICLLAISVTAEASQSLDNKTFKVFPNIRFVEGVDLPAFMEAYSKTMSAQRADYVSQAKDLMSAGAYGAEAAKMLMDFDNHILDLRARGKSRMGVTLEASFKAQLDELYRKYNPPVYRLQFHSVYANPTPSFDLFIYGVYSVKSVGRPGLLMTVTVVDLKTGLERSYEAQGVDVNAARLLARQVFDDHQKTKFPSSKKVMGKTLQLVTRGLIELEDGRRSPMRDLHKSAQWACDSYDARLVSENELKALVGIGEYRGGLTLARMGEQNYFWAVDGEQVLVSYSGAVMNDTNMNPASYLNYICVK